MFISIYLAKCNNAWVRKLWRINYNFIHLAYLSALDYLIYHHLSYHYLMIAERICRYFFVILQVLDIPIRFVNSRLCEGGAGVGACE